MIYLYQLIYLINHFFLLLAVFIYYLFYSIDYLFLVVLMELFI